MVKAQPIWSGTDFPYQCLLDTKRTEAFRAAIHATVRRGDAVLDAGSGSGILSFFAAEAGAGSVVAVEVDPYLAECLEHSVAANGLSDRIEVVCGDIRTVRLPCSFDVLVSEMIDTGLLDEVQATAVNHLRAQGVLTQRTRMVPGAYDTFVELGAAGLDYYGYRILMPKHRWPHCTVEHTGWLPVPFVAATERMLVGSVDFHQPVPLDVARELSFVPAADGTVNAVRLTGRAYLTDDSQLGATNAFNGDKIVPIEPVALRAGQPTRLSVSYTLGGGLASLHVKVGEEAK